MRVADLPPTAIVVPTYDERENLERLVPALLELSPTLEVVVVDDASPDGTGEVAERLAAATGRVRVVRRPGKLGLGSAYRDGFRLVLASTAAELVAQMDADLSHAPDDMARLLAAARDGLGDVVVGSRHVRGAAILDWPLRRRLLSRAGSFYARFVTGLPQRDATSGMKVWRRAALERIDLDRVRADGYGFQIEMSWLAWKLGLSLHEAPITFVDRAGGASKMSGRIVREALLLCLRLRFRRPPAAPRRAATAVA